jgi:hypothetical protein
MPCVPFQLVSLVSLNAHSRVLLLARRPSWGKDLPGVLDLVHAPADAGD